MRRRRNCLEPKEGLCQILCSTGKEVAESFRAAVLNFWVSALVQMTSLPSLKEARKYKSVRLAGA